MPRGSGSEKVFGEIEKNTAATQSNAAKVSKSLNDLEVICVLEGAAVAWRGQCKEIEIYANVVQKDKRSSIFIVRELEKKTRENLHCLLLCAKQDFHNNSLQVRGEMSQKVGHLFCVVFRYFFFLFCSCYYCSVFFCQICNRKCYKNKTYTTTLLIIPQLCAIYAEKSKQLEKKKFPTNKYTYIHISLYTIVLTTQRSCWFGTLWCTVVTHYPSQLWLQAFMGDPFATWQSMALFCFIFLHFFNISFKFCFLATFLLCYFPVFSERYRTNLNLIEAQTLTQC